MKYPNIGHIYLPLPPAAVIDRKWAKAVYSGMIDQARKPRAIIFDWDDTLVDTFEVVRKAVNTTLDAMGANAWSEEEARRRIGPPARVLFTDLFGEDRWQEADLIYIKAYEDNIAGALRKYPHVDDILGVLHALDISLFVVSTKRGYLLRKEAESLGLGGYFKRLVGASDALNDKPHADAVLFALEGSDIKAGPDVWFLGDAYTDLMTAKNSGTVPILIETKLPPAEKLTEHPPAMRFKTHADLLAHIRQWSAGPAPVRKLLSP